MSDLDALLLTSGHATAEDALADAIISLGYQPFVGLEMVGGARAQVALCPTQNDAEAFIEELKLRGAYAGSPFVRGLCRALMLDRAGAIEQFVAWIDAGPDAVVDLPSSEAAPFVHYVGYPLLRCSLSEASVQGSADRARALALLVHGYARSGGNDFLRWNICEAAALALAQRAEAGEIAELARQAVDDALLVLPDSAPLRAARERLTGPSADQSWPADAAGSLMDQGPQLTLPAEFDPAVYLRLHQDVAEAGADPVDHYLIHGRSEGRRLVFDEADPQSLSAEEARLWSAYCAAQPEPDDERDKIEFGSDFSGYGWGPSVAFEDGAAGRVIGFGRRAAVFTRWKADGWVELRVGIDPEAARELVEQLRVFVNGEPIREPRITSDGKCCFEAALRHLDTAPTRVEFLLEAPPSGSAHDGGLGLALRSIEFRQLALPAEFDPAVYLRLHKDVAETGIDPIDHYFVRGRYEDRRLVLPVSLLILDRLSTRLAPRVAQPVGGPEFDAVVQQAFDYYTTEFPKHRRLDEHLGFRLTDNQNDVSRQVYLLERFISELATLNGRSLDLQCQLSVLLAIGYRFHTDQAPFVLYGKLCYEQGWLWEAFDAACGGLEFDTHCEMSVSVLLAAVERISQGSAWEGFFKRTASPCFLDLRAGDQTEFFWYLTWFRQSVFGCDSLHNPAIADFVRMFYHTWRKIYRQTDSRIGLFRAYGNSDRSRHIAALRHIVEFAAARRLGASTICDSRGRLSSDSLRVARELTVALGNIYPEAPIFLLAADYSLAANQLEDALQYGRRAFNIDSRCLIAQHILDCVEDAIESRSEGGSYSLSLLRESPRRFPGRFCNVPFDEAYINPAGDTFLCCAATLPVSVGNIFESNDWESVWNSSAAQEVRASILDGSYKYCNKRGCPKLLSDGLTREPEISNLFPDDAERYREIISQQQLYVHDTPFADLGYDASCNLSCPQCRLDVFVLDRPGFSRLDSARAGMVDDLLSRLHRVRITSGGEALFSRHFRKLLSEINPETCPHLTDLELLTNGILFDSRQWETFENLHYLKILVCFSIDACSKETFETIRRGGRWDKLVNNLEFAGSLRVEEKIATLQVSYAVQAANFREMPDMVRMAERFHVDVVNFFKLENVGTYSEEEYRARNVVEPSHPEHQEFLEVLRDPVFLTPMVSGYSNLGAVLGPARGM